MSEFVFRHFTVRQEKSAMKIGTDSVLLGCCCEAANAQQVLDIGTGTGLLALMLAQKSHALIDAVEADEPAALEASDNFKASRWHERLFLHHQTIQQYTLNCKKKYDVIISNPPYFKTGKNVHISDEQRSRARHDAGLSFDELAEIVKQLLHPGGSFWLILPAAEAALFKQTASGRKLYCYQAINARPKADQAVNRIIMQFGLHNQACEEKEFVVYRSDNTPSIEYKQLARDFYTGSQFRE
jgi:tRNA1Val (adenine37-N6)-methyltransferase